MPVPTKRRGVVETRNISVGKKEKGIALAFISPLGRTLLPKLFRSLLRVLVFVPVARGAVRRFIGKK